MRLASHRPPGATARRRDGLPLRQAPPREGRGGRPPRRRSDTRESVRARGGAQEDDAARLTRARTATVRRRREPLSMRPRLISKYSFIPMSQAYQQAG